MAPSAANGPPVYPTYWQNPSVDTTRAALLPSGPSAARLEPSTIPSSARAIASAPSESMFNVLSPVFTPDDALVHYSQLTAVHPPYAPSSARYYQQQPVPVAGQSYVPLALAADSDGTWHPDNAGLHAAVAPQRPLSTPSSSSSNMAANEPLIGTPAGPYRALTHSPDEQEPAPPAKRKRVLKARPTAPEGVVITEKSCARCRIRKVKCDRTFPICANCKLRAEDCDLVSLHPKDKQTATAREQQASDRITQLETRLAHLEALLRHKSETSPVPTPLEPHSPAPVPTVDIGHSSLDWKLATPVMAESLSRHLCEGKLGANQILVEQAHVLSFKQALADEPTVDNLAALLALLQMTSFAEVVPRKSRTTLRLALGHFKELQDRASNPTQIRAVQQQFGFALFTIDALNSAYARRACLITDSDFEQYFSQADIDLRPLPDAALLDECKKLLQSDANKQVLHLIACWTSTCQRKFAILASPRPSSLDDVDAAARNLLASIDNVRAVVRLVQSQAPLMERTDSDDCHSHDSDVFALVVRHDRDLLDLVSLLHMMICSLRQPGLPRLAREVDRRARKALKVQAFYFKFYAHCRDAHMSYHSFQNLELVPTWTRMALEKMGDPNGPRAADEELTTEELDWLVEGVRNACFFTPAAERRLKELARTESRIRAMPTFDKLVKIDGPDGHL
ncbi:hypothetical protein OIV83_003318 [Microbotryomycetes sp. JL201]|nr:hypothetical protein OIV83_003318 [Microbotryomycetes sp. JL201]